MLHDRPLSPSLTAIVSARRIVLGWDVRYSAVGGDDRLRDVNRFYSSAQGSPDAALDVLRRYHVTHVIVRPADDRVHPAVLARLTLMVQFPDVVLYSVPPLQSSPASAVLLSWGGAQSWSAPCFRNSCVPARLIYRGC